MMTTAQQATDYPRERGASLLIFDILLIVVLLIGAVLRGIGLFWGEYQYLHPDERFLVWVGTDITPISGIDPETNQKNWISISEYFNTPDSPLNPNNRGHGFYVYGTFPMFLTRIVVEWVFGHSGFDQMTQVGRIFSALADLVIILLVYLVANRIYDRRVGILAAAFSALVVLQIQQSHFFTMDTFVNTFSLLAFYFAIRIQTDKRPWDNRSITGVDPDTPDIESEPGSRESEDESQPPKHSHLISQFIKHPLFLPSLGFGIAFGMAMSSKLNALPVALVLPAAIAVRILSSSENNKYRQALSAIGYLVLAGAVSILVFRILQPYAFSGPSFFGITPNPAWLAQIRELRSQASIHVDFPPAMQWARRPITFSFQNMILWGLGLPLGLLAWAGFIWAGIRMLKGEWQKHAVVWGWTAVYFVWQSLALNPTMRYMLPIYPTLVIFAAWCIIQLYDYGRRSEQVNRTRSRLAKISSIAIGSIVLLATAIYAIGFTGIYSRPITRLEASRWIIQNIPGALNLRIETDDGIYNQPVPFHYDYAITPEVPFITNFRARESGTLRGVYLPHVRETSGDNQEKTLSVIVKGAAGEGQSSNASLSSSFGVNQDLRGDSYSLTFDQPIRLEKDQSYELMLTLIDGAGGIALEGATLANEGEWDDAIPYRVDGFDPFGGIYPIDVNFNMYWEENQGKLDRFLRILDESDYIAITSSRQWGSLPRIPERFPLSTLYYQELIGCPPDKTIEWCYNVAEPGTFTGRLGFDLVETFISDPSIGPIKINDQFAEEAFTVYDHPKVFIFEKNEAYDQQYVTEVLSSVDFSKIIRLPPLQYESGPSNLELPQDRLEEQSSGGTWSEIFNTNSILNRYPLIGAIVWYITLGLLGVLVYPIVRSALPGLSDHGYPLARTAGLLILSYMVWLAGSVRIPFNRTTITAVIALIALFSIYLVTRQGKSLLSEIKNRSRYFLAIEGLFLLLFVIDLLIRYGNPDLWHPWKGGEKPMDFAYLNAVLKSTSFPPYDPWYAGGYLNYYYYGFMLIGVLVKWLGIVPSIAYNLIIPTMFSLIGMGAFSVVWNLVSAKQNAKKHDLEGGITPPASPRYLPYAAGIAGILGMAILGNLGTIKMVLLGFQRLAAPGIALEEAGVVDRILWSFQGLIETFKGASLPYSLGDWYWLPSRIIPALNEIEPITEFPFFTVLYADPHAHLYALPLALLAISFALSVVLAHGRWESRLSTVTGLVLGGLAIGVLFPVNTWDFPTYLVLGAICLGYALWRSLKDQTWGEKIPIIKQIPRKFQGIVLTVIGVSVLVGLALVLFKPYTDWYALGYSKINLWQGTRTPLHAYLLHWGLFLFLIVSWMTWETIDWMANTPVSALQKIKKHRELILVGTVVIIVVIVGLGIKLPGFNDSPFGNGINIAWLVIPLAVWSGLLILRSNQPDAKRFVLFLVGTGLILTLMVEIIVLTGDAARMNTVFKFYLQVWTLFSISAAASLAWLVPNLPGWTSKWRTAWQVTLILLVAGTAMYPLMATRAKIEDRMAVKAPFSLDGMEYMKYATYLDEWGEMDLSQDYEAIRWLQENVEGSPTIVEANLRNLYRWGSRFSIYTGLPGIVGWEWHQQQQRSLFPGSWVTERIFEVDEIYQTSDPARALEILQKYNVRYIILGQQERGHYAGPGLDKFEEQDGILWDEVFRFKDTVIYKIRNSRPTTSLIGDDR